MRLIDADALIEFCAERWIPLNIDAVNMQPTIQPDHVADIGKKVGRTAESAQNVSDSDLIFRKAAIDAIARMMPRSYTPDGSHPADEEIFKAQEVYADCIKSIEALPAVQPKTTTMTIGRTKGEITMWYECNNCGEPVDQSDNYCWNCGRRFKKDE